MQQRLASLRESPVAFAHRGARAHAPENTLEAFRLALRLGANGLETDAWLSSDGRAVLDHDGTVRRGLRRRPLSAVESADLPPHMPLLDDVLADLGSGYHLSIDLKDPTVIGAIADAVTSAGFPADNLWLCSPDIDILGRAGDLVPGAYLVHSTRLSRMENGFERHCDRLRTDGIAAVNLHHSEWNGGNVVMCHRFGLMALGWDAQHREHLETLLLMGIDGVFSDHVDLMVDCFESLVGRPGLPG